jgi:hypothetical protein
MFGVVFLALTACGGGGPEASGLGGPVAVAPPPVVVGTEQAVEKGCAGRSTDAAVDEALASGRVGDLTEDDLFKDIFGQLSCAIEDADDVRAAFFSLDDTYASTDNTLTSITWDPTHDAGLLEPAADSVTLLHSNAVTRTDRTVLNAALAIAGQTKSARHLAFGSNPMRTIWRGGEAEGMTEFMQNGIGWLTQRDDLATGDLKVVIAQMAQSYYFPDQVSVRSWLDAQYGTRVTYNEATACDDAALSGCLTDSPDLLIISQVGDEPGVPELVKAAMDAGTPVLYMHYDGGLTSLGAKLLPLLGARYVRDNYWQNQSISNFNGTEQVGKISAEDQALQNILEHFEGDDFAFDFVACADRSCPADHGYISDFLTPVETLKSRIDAFDRSTMDLFALEGSRRDKALVLLADRFRAEARFPMDKVATPKGEFLRSMFADHVVHTARSVAPLQADLGNFSRSDFSHVTPVTKTVTLTARQYYSAAGVYAIPGQTVRVTRTDQSDVTTHIRVNLLRSGATHEFEDNGYKRPKHLSSVDMPIKPGGSLSFTSPHGGPIQVRFNNKDLETRFTFENVGEHAVWRSAADDADFAARIDADDFDWAELITPGFQVHSKSEKMRETLNHPVWPSAAMVAEATQQHLHNLPHVLGGFKGDGIDVVPEIHDFATTNGLEIHTLDTVKHMNADQATCGYGCSGNPYDAYWNFNPIGHGDIHELGHGLERSRFRYTGQPGHTGTNPYSYFSKSEFYKETGNTSDLGCQNLPYNALFETVQASRKTTDPAQYMRDQNLTGWNQGAAINLQIMMAAQDLGLLENGYNLLARQHIIDREFNLADNSDEAWAGKKDGLGFGAFMRTDAQSLSNNDWNLIALSHALNRNLSDYLELWGFELSDTAKAAVSDKVDFPTDFYVAGSQAHCTGFPTEKLPVDGDQVWPLAGKTTEKFEAKTDHHAH